MGALYSLLEHDTATGFLDEFVDVPLDTSQIIWVATANNAKDIPEPILNRMYVFEVRELTRDEARIIGLILYKQIRRSHEWGKQFDEDPSEEVLEHLSKMVPREMRRAITRAFGNAKLDSRYTLEVKDFPQEQR
jgi:ATP-dependent Lon protease